MKNPVMSITIEERTSLEIESHMHLLIIDDNTDDISLMSRCLEPAVESIVGTTTVSEAIDKIAQEDFDCVLVDYLMPDTSGLDIVKQLRDSGLTCPIIMVTGCHDRLVATKCIQEGAQNYFPKEFITTEPNLFRECVTHTANQQMLETTARLSVLSAQMRAFESRITPSKP